MALSNVQSSSELEKIVKSADLSVVHFCAEWAAQCTTVTSCMRELASSADLSAVRFFLLQAESVPEASLAHGVTSVPTVILFRGGKAVGRVDGARAPELTKKVRQAAQEGSNNAEGTLKGKEEDINDRLKKLINAAPVMLFMKGNPQEPRCGFSKQSVAILNDYKARYSTFDILSSDEVRQGLKEFSNWPTYPQLYINGELIGGLDIMREMSENGELAAMLPKKQPLEERLGGLVRKHNIMVFMKGDAETPRCGFSRQLIDILKGAEVEFETFDILQDEEVRQGLKTFSSWPTYPQVYVKGELIGGLDIVKEMQESGDLLATLRGDS